MSNTRYKGVFMHASWVDTSQSGLSVAISHARLREDLPVDMVLGYENEDMIDRLQREMKLSEQEARDLFIDLKKFLWLAATSSHDLVPTPVIDEAWHRFILYTQDYKDFCEQFFGGFLHHAPKRKGDKNLTHDDLRMTIDEMDERLGGIPSPNWHYMPAASMAAV